MKTGNKKKITRAITFPKVLDMSPYVDGPAGGTVFAELAVTGTSLLSSASAHTASNTYHLCALLLHRGKSTNQGHYVAQIREAQTGSWHVLDDDLTRAETQDKNNIFAMGGEVKKAPVKKKPTKGDESDTESPGRGKKKDKAGGGKNAEEVISTESSGNRFSSSQVYMLVYRRADLIEKQASMQSKPPDNVAEIAEAANRELDEETQSLQARLDQRRQRIIAECQKITGICEHLDAGEGVRGRRTGSWLLNFVFLSRAFRGPALGLRVGATPVVEEVVSAGWPQRGTHCWRGGCWRQAATCY